MANVIVAAVIILILALGIVYIVRAKRRGAHCIGCPSSGGGKDCSCSTKPDDTDKTNGCGPDCGCSSSK